MSTTEVKSAPTSEQPQPTTENESTKPSESPNTTKKSYKGALTTEESAKQQTENNTTTTTTTTPTESTTASEADSTNNETRKPRASSKSKSINLHKPAWKNNKKKVTKVKRSLDSNSHLYSGRRRRSFSRSSSLANIGSSNYYSICSKRKEEGFSKRRNQRTPKLKFQRIQKEMYKIVFRSFSHFSCKLGSFTN